jgi:hypothetical protein
MGAAISSARLQMVLLRNDVFIVFSSSLEVYEISLQEKV